jgi:hypothetical protein
MMQRQYDEVFVAGIPVHATAAAAGNCCSISTDTPPLHILIFNIYIVVDTDSVLLSLTHDTAAADRCLGDSEQYRSLTAPLLTTIAM